ncbi:MAG: TlpA family protein disulfide reductase [Dehalococcoidia bacterium]|nr:TlpA family protein disulfide reductase [Dehalococcoidia bacterium]MDW8119056.1 TlpA disulfide reductase family protein [Chloroflexota bacterium]
MELGRLRLGFLLQGLAILGGLVLVVVSVVQPPTVTSSPRLGEQKVREPAPDFTLSLFDGGQFRLGNYHGQVVVINFWGSWCPPCRAEMPALQKVWETYQSQGLVLVGVNVQDTEAAARAFLREAGVTFPTGPDSDGTITTAYRVVGFPTTVFINRQGQVVRRWTGAITQERLTMLVEDLLR